MVLLVEEDGDLFKIARNRKRRLVHVRHRCVRVASGNESISSHAAVLPSGLDAFPTSDFFVVDHQRDVADEVVRFERLLGGHKSKREFMLTRGDGNVGLDRELFQLQVVVDVLQFAILDKERPTTELTTETGQHTFSATFSATFAPPSAPPSATFGATFGNRHMGGHGMVLTK